MPAYIAYEGYHFGLLERQGGHVAREVQWTQDRRHGLSHRRESWSWVQASRLVDLGS